MTSFNDLVLKILLEAGWDNHRQIDIHPILNKMTSSGAFIVLPAIEFLKQFGNLKLLFTNKKNSKPDDIDFNPIRAMEIETLDRLQEDYEPRLGNKKLTFIGTAYREHFVLVMDENGAVFGGYDDFLVKIANSGEGAIEAIVQDYEFEEIV